MVTATWAPVVELNLVLHSFSLPVLPGKNRSALHQLAMVIGRLRFQLGATQRMISPVRDSELLDSRAVCYGLHEIEGNVVRPVILISGM